jgi:hypothetical protein
VVVKLATTAAPADCTNRLLLSRTATPFVLAFLSFQQLPSGYSLVYTGEFSLNCLLTQIQVATLQGIGCYEAWLIWFTEGFDTADLKEAKALLDELRC